MESINVEKIHALKKYKQQQYIKTLLFYPLAALTFGAFCTSPFWFPSTKTFICVSIPRILSLFFSAKSLFILGNLIVVFLVRESKFRPSNSSYNSHQIKILPKKDKVGFEEIKKCTVSPSISNEVISERPFESEVVGFSFNEITNGVSYENEIERHGELLKFEEKKEKEVEDEPMWLNKGRRESSSRKDETEVDEVVRRENLSTDELTRRADDFIAKVNRQIRLEAEETLVLPVVM